MKTIIIAFFIALFIWGGTSSFAFVSGGSNLRFRRYPEFDAFPPSRPFNNDEFSWSMYRNDLDSYKNECEDYLDNARYDIKRIQQAMQEAVEKYNSVINEANRGY